MPRSGHLYLEVVIWPSPGLFVRPGGVLFPGATLPHFSFFPKKTSFLEHFVLKLFWPKKSGREMQNHLPATYYEKKCAVFSLILCMKMNNTPRFVHETRYKPKTAPKSDLRLIPRGNFSPPTPIVAEKYFFGKTELETFFGIF